MAGSSIAPDQAAHELPRYAVDRTTHIKKLHMNQAAPTPTHRAANRV